MTIIVTLKHVLSVSAAVLVTSFATQAVYAQTTSMGLSPNDNMLAPANSTKLMPNAPLGSEYPTHGNQQAGEMNLNPTDPRAQCAAGVLGFTAFAVFGSTMLKAAVFR